MCNSAWSLIGKDTARNSKSEIPDASHTTSYELSGSFIVAEEALVDSDVIEVVLRHPILHSRRLNSNEMCSYL